MAGDDIARAMGAQSSASFVQISGRDFDDFIGDLRQAQTGLAKEKRRANKEVAEEIATLARAAAGSGSKMERHFAAAIQGRATQYVARIGISSRSTMWGANTAFFGAKRRAGWYAAQKYGASPARQFPEWVGSSWTAGVRGEGPYVINDVIASQMPRIEQLYMEAHERAYSRAFPGGMTA